MTSIRVTPIMTNVIGEKEFFVGEPGSPEFYSVTHVLGKYLGEENIEVSWNENDFVYDIKERDEACDNTFDYIKIIESIQEPFEPFEPFNYKDEKKDYLTFKIIIFVD